jgi:hypothetical protein
MPITNGRPFYGLLNELTAKFRAAPVAPDIWQSNASQRAYEGCRLKIGLIM